MPQNHPYNVHKEHTLILQVVMVVQCVLQAMSVLVQLLHRSFVAEGSTVLEVYQLALCVQKDIMLTQLLLVNVYNVQQVNHAQTSPVHQ